MRAGVRWRVMRKARGDMGSQQRILKASARRVSRVLFIVAIACTATFVSLAFGLTRSWLIPAAQPSLRANVSPDTSSSVLIRVSRLPGGPTEWNAYAAAILRIAEVTGHSPRVTYASLEEDGSSETGRSPEYAFLSTYQYLLAKREGQVPRIVATPVIDGHSTEAAVVVVAADSGFESLADLEGCAVAVSDSTSLGGCAYLRWLLDARGLGKLEDYFGAVEAGRSQDTNLRTVVEGDVDATVVNRSQIAAYEEGAFRIIEHSPEYGMPPLVCSSAVEPSECGRVREALLEMSPGEGLPAGGSLQGFAFTPYEDYAFAEMLMPYALDPTHEDTGATQ